MSYSEAKRNKSTRPIDYFDLVYGALLILHSMKNIVLLEEDQSPNRKLDLYLMKNEESPESFKCVKKI